MQLLSSGLRKRDSVLVRGKGGKEQARSEGDGAYIVTEQNTENNRNEGFCCLTWRDYARLGLVFFCV